MFLQSDRRMDRHCLCSLNNEIFNLLQRQNHAVFRISWIDTLFFSATSIEGIYIFFRFFRVIRSCIAVGM